MTARYWTSPPALKENGWLQQVDFLRCNVSDLQALQRLAADTVVMNPPFGTRRKGADLDFLRAAFQVLHLRGSSMLHTACILTVSLHPGPHGLSVEISGIV